MRTEVGVSQRSWVSFVEDSCSHSWSEIQPCGVERGVDQSDDIGLVEVPESHAFGALELPRDVDICGAHIVNDVLALVRQRREGCVGDLLRRARARLEVMRCDRTRDLAVHEMAIAIADYGLGEYDGLAEHVASARNMQDDAFSMVGAMMIALGMGEIAAARKLSAEALQRFPRNAWVLRQAGDIYQCTMELHSAIDVLSTLFDIAREADASFSILEDLAWEVAGLSDLTELCGWEPHCTDFVAPLQTAVDCIHSQGHKLLGIQMSHPGIDTTMIQLYIDGNYASCTRADFAIWGAFDAQYPNLRLDHVSVYCSPHVYQGVTDSDNAEGQ